MKIFRVETPDGEGPFIGEHSFDMLATHLFSSETHPSPWRDDLEHMIGLGRPNKCGCDSIQSLKGWFNAIEVNKLTGVRLDDRDDRNYLLRATERDLGLFKLHGFGIAVYEVEDDECEYGLGLTQLAFPTSRATLIETLPIDVLFS
jgi:hypothetical protein